MRRRLPHIPSVFPSAVRAYSIEALERRVLLAAPDVLFGTENPVNNAFYYVLSPSTWAEAEAKAQELGGHLATIDDADENEFVRSTFGGDDRFLLWIGLNDRDDEGKFAWAAGNPVSFLNWRPGQPGQKDADAADVVVMYAFNPLGGWRAVTDAPAVELTGHKSFDVYGIVEVPGDTVTPTPTPTPPPPEIQASLVSPPLANRPVTLRRTTSYSFDVQFSVDTIDPASLGDDDIDVIGPADLDNPIHAEHVAGTTSYRFTAPGGTFDEHDNGTYQVQLNAGAVSGVVDGQTVFVTPGAIGALDITVSDLDLNFGTGASVDPNFVVEDAAFQPSASPDDPGRLIVVGHETDFETSRFIVRRFNLDDGSPDATFGEGGQFARQLGGGGGGGGGAGSVAYSVSVLEDGSMFVTGSALHAGGPGNSIGSSVPVAVRLTRDGSLDESFGDGGVAIAKGAQSTDALASLDSLVLNNQLLLVVSGYEFQSGRPVSFLYAYSANNYHEESGEPTDMESLRFAAGDFLAQALTDQGDKIVIAGSMERTAGVARSSDFAVTRFNAGDLSPDDGSSADAVPGDFFGDAGLTFVDFAGAHDAARSIAVRRDNQAIVVAGRAEAAEGRVDFAVAQLLKDGGLDPGFAAATGAGDDAAVTPAGTLTLRLGTGESRATSVLIEDDNGGNLDAGGIIASGIATADDGVTLVDAVARFSPAGGFDAGFGNAGALVPDAPEPATPPPAAALAPFASEGADPQLDSKFTNFIEFARSIVVKIQGGAIAELARLGDAVTIKVVPADDTRPAITLVAENVEFELSVERLVLSISDSGLDVATLDSSDVSVVGPDGLSRAVSFVTYDTLQSGEVYATYNVKPAGTKFTTAGNGEYRVALADQQIGDLSGNLAAGIADLGTFTVDIAPDAPPPPPEPKVQVLLGSDAFDDNQTKPAQFGSARMGDAPPAAITFTVRNVGNGSLQLGRVTAPRGFVLTRSPATSVKKGGDTTLAVRLDNAVAGKRAGTLTFATGDSDVPIFHLRLTGVVENDPDPDPNPDPGPGSGPSPTPTPAPQPGVSVTKVEAKKLPATIIRGGERPVRIAATVALEKSADADPLGASLTITLFASHDGTAAPGTTVQLDSTTTVLKLKPRATRTLKVNANIAPAMPEGDYSLIAVITGDGVNPAGATSPKGPPIHVEDPRIVLVPDETGAPSTATAGAGRAASLKLPVHNAGNVAATGAAAVDLKLTQNPGDPPTSTSHTTTKLSIKPGVSKTLKLKLDAAPPTPGTYFVLVYLAGVESNETNGQLVATIELNVT